MDVASQSFRRPAPIPAPPARAYVVGASKERLATIRARLAQDGIDVCGHCDRPREFAPPQDAAFMLLITDMGSHATLQKARDWCRAHGVPCVGGLWRTWSTTRARLASLGPAVGCGACAAQGCPVRRAGRDLRTVN